jgi:hypothetical protein
VEGSREDRCGVEEDKKEGGGQKREGVNAENK